VIEINFIDSDEEYILPFDTILNKTTGITMRTLICDEPGSLSYIERPRPARNEGQVLLQVTHVGICGTDLHAYEGKQPYFTYPRVLGHEVAAVVAESAKGSAFKEGDVVTFLPYFNCGICLACRNNKPNCCIKLQVAGVHIDGAMGDYIQVPEANVAASQGLTPELLALVEPLSIGAHAVSRANIGEQGHVLVIGAGPIGLGIIQLARIAGGQVIVLDVNEERLAFCSGQLNVKHVINAKEDDVFDRLMAITNGEMASVVIDASGNLAAINNAFQYLAHTGKFVLVGLQKEAISFSHPEFHKREATLMSSRNATVSDFQHVIALMKSGELDPSPFITHRVDFASVASNFPGWLKQDSGIIKAIITM
jgi:2-desacetyl-2-hydroxyethyl bacteriochlorophyllide A dehydrogenase